MMLGLRLYRTAMRLYPAGYRERFGEEMMAVFCELQSETVDQGRMAISILYCRELAGLAGAAVREHWRALGGEDLWLPFSNRRFTMRNTGFRFPKTTVVLMTIILAGVILAIRKGEAIEHSLPNVSPPVGPIHSVPSTLLPGVVVGFACFYAAGLIGWAILFALRRSGIHRLDEASAK